MSHFQQTRQIGVFMSKACAALQRPTDGCNDGVLSNKISGARSNPPATSSTVKKKTTLAFLWCSHGAQMSS